MSASCTFVACCGNQRVWPSRTAALPEIVVATPALVDRLESAPVDFRGAGTSSDRAGVATAVASCRKSAATVVRLIIAVVLLAFLRDQARSRDAAHRRTATVQPA